MVKSVPFCDLYTFRRVAVTSLTKPVWVVSLDTKDHVFLLNMFKHRKHVINAFRNKHVIHFYLNFKNTIMFKFRVIYIERTVHTSVRTFLQF